MAADASFFIGFSGVPAVVHHPHVEMRPDLLAGGPVVKGSRVPVRRIWNWHQKGVAVDTLLRRYSTLRPASVLSALAFAYDNQELIEADLGRERALLADEPPGTQFTRRVPLGWASKVRHAGGDPVSRACAHYLDEDGQPACAKLTHVSKERGLETRLAPFTCAWGPLHDEHHLCRDCKRLRDPKKSCRCGKCRVVPSTPKPGSAPDVP